MRKALVILVSAMVFLVVTILIGLGTPILIGLIVLEPDGPVGDGMLLLMIAVATVPIGLIVGSLAAASIYGKYSSPPKPHLHPDTPFAP